MRIAHSNRNAEPQYSESVRTLLDNPPSEPSAPDPNQWPDRRSPERTVLLVPAADYHLDELVPLAGELRQRGIQCMLAVGESPWDRTKRGMARYPDIDIFWLPEPEVVQREVSVVVTLKDTGSMTDWVTAVRNRGVPVVGKVEGAQDFWDADTPEQRRPYRNFDLVLCQGEFDAKALTNQETTVVGSSRLERLWNAPPIDRPELPLAVINLNFVYGVRTDDRAPWLETAIEACTRSSIDYLISVHPAEKTKVTGSRMTRLSASSLLPHASLLISRFSTVPMEALAMGVPFIYHNPQSETVATYRDPLGAFEVSDSVDSLASAIANLIQRRDTPRSDASEWFGTHISIDSHLSSESRAADVCLNDYLVNPE